MLIAVLPVSVTADVTGQVRVVDGDTLDVAGTRVRLHGIDAPERAQTCITKQGVNWACGAWVGAQVRTRYEGKRAICQRIETDRYGRMVARCKVDGQDIGQQLVSDGLAFAYRRYSMDYDLDEKAAAVNGRGLHGSQVQRPAEYRRSGGQVSPAPDAACAIKGNISASGRIYHLPGQADYQRTRINTAKGERWFCSEAQARQAGWRRARR